MKFPFFAKLLLAISLLTMTGAGASFAAGYPTKPVNMIIAFTAGGSSDVQARIMQKYWNKLVDAQWTFIYKPGAGGAIGFGEIAMAKKDGYTIGGVNIPHLIIQPLVQKAQFKITDFDYICQVVNDPQAVVVRTDSRFKSVQEIFDYAKANPGKLKVGLVGPNSGHHLMFLDVQEKFGFPVTEVFYKGAADQNAAVLGGEIDVMFGNLNDVMRSIEELNVLALAAEERNQMFLPDVPTMKELGFDIVSDIRRAFVAPKGIKAEQLAFLRDTFKKICEDSEYLKDMKQAGQPAEYMDGDSLYTYMQSQEKKIKAALTADGQSK